MEIVLIITGIVAVAALVLLSLRLRARRASVRPSQAAGQWRGSAAAGRRAAGAAPAAAASGGVVALVSMGGGGTAVKDPPRTRDDDVDAWDDDLEWIP